MRQQDLSKGVYVLLVEDDRDDFFLAQELLQRVERERYWIVWAGSYDRAKYEMRERTFDVALVDYRIGDRSGLDFIAEVGPHHPHCPMILLTELDDPDIDFAAERAGAADYLVKDCLTEERLDRSIRYVRQSARRRALLENVFSHATAGMIGIDPTGKPIIWNRKAVEVLELDHVAIPELSPGMITDALSRGPAESTGPTEITRADGRTFELSMSRMSEGGSVAVLHDTTARVQTEQQLRQAVFEAERANTAKSSFLATMSHELRTPLNGILGMTRLLEGTPLTEVQTDGIDVIKSSGTTLLNIINDILDLSKIEAGRMELERIEFSTTELVDDVLRLLAPTAAEKGIELAGFVDPLVTSVYCGDPLRVRQMLTNLVGNAIKFTAAGAITIALDEATVRGRPMLCFSVIDTGIGIPSHKLETLFVKFSQVDASTAREYGGTGLGLALCKELVALMGGEISCSSLPDHGSTFRFLLPIPDEHTVIALARQASVQCLGARLLLASQSTGIASVLGSYARSMAARLTICNAIEPARRALESTIYDAAILDGAVGSSGVGELLNCLRAKPSTAQRLFLLEGTPGQGRAIGLSEEEILPRPFSRQTFDRILKRMRDRVAETSAAREAMQTESVTRRLRILMAEDNPSNQRVANALLRAAGYGVEMVGNGRTALERALAEEFDIVLMDVQMPIMDGLVATRRLREYERLTSLPVIGLTAGAMEEDRNRCLAAGMTGYLSKPIDWDQLLGLLDRLERECYAPQSPEGVGQQKAFG